MPDWRFSACDFFAYGFFVSDRINRMDKMTSKNVKRENSVDSVHSVEKPLPNGATGTSDKDGEAATSSGERGGSRTSFNSKKTYVSGKLHPDIRVPFLSSRAKSRDLSTFLYAYEYE
jgi:hypothetical protein